MTNSAAKERLRVSTDGTAGPYIMVLVSQLDEVRRHFRDFEEDQTLRRGVNVVRDIVHLADQRQNFVAVQRRDERLVEQIDRLVRDAVALVLQFLEPFRLFHLQREVFGRLEHALRRLPRRLRVALEKLKKLVFFGEESFEQGPPRSREMLCSG